MPLNKTGKTGVELFARIDLLARNLWWSWNHDVQRLFAALHPVAWEATNHNPIALLAGLTPEHQAALLEDKAFTDLLRYCEAQWQEYRNAKTWFDRTSTPPQRKLQVAYFCMEFAIHECLPLYAGGLGVLAGDHLKSASDLGVPLVGIGLLYRHGYYQQSLGRDGSTKATYPTYDFGQWPIHDTRVTIQIPIGKRNVTARIWRVDVGRVPLFLLDTDIRQNSSRDRKLTDALYSGDSAHRIEQEILLGMGGVRALNALGIKATVYHLNEGHAAFCIWERWRQEKTTGNRAFLKHIRDTTVFTTHTPVAAGHDRFPQALMRRYFQGLTQELGWQKFDTLAALGWDSSQPAKQHDFCMTVLALHFSARCNGVSKLHGEVSRRMWKHLYGTENADEVPIGHVTNGVHTRSWLAPEMEDLVYRRYLKPQRVGVSPDEISWKNVDRIPDGLLWNARTLLRSRLVHFIRQRHMAQAQRRLDASCVASGEALLFDDYTLTIGFARRFATYKRAPLIFSDRKRLARILNDADRPVQLVFAGKAHPRDYDGQKYAQEVFRLSQHDDFFMQVALIQNYDMHVGRMLTSGCDVWLNNPLRPQEASGTSGMKPPLHGGINCSILDGWWPEAYNGKNGWAIGNGRIARTVHTSERQVRTPHASEGVFKSRSKQDRYDADSLYDLLENQIVPLFYKRDRRGIPQGWVKMMKESMKTVCGPFSAHRMVAEYVRHYYLHDRNSNLRRVNDNARGTTN